ncbi:MAG: LacI family DNA-binding transcriptional regulator [Opitutaceae bacterium]|nr:LacI family DNA-binding transcriptional regulator [Opitutaceae bacterium]
MSTPKRVNIQAIADKVGVSKATVSRALRNLPGHKAATKDKIIKAAQELGYESHPIMSAVMSSVRFKRTSLISPVIAEIHCQPWDYDREGNPDSLRRGIHRQAEALGFRVEEFGWYEPGMNPRRLIDIIRARGIGAVIFEHFMEREVDLSSLDLSGLAMVSIGGAHLNPNLHRVEVNHYGNMIKLIKKLQDRGYQRFGVIIPKIFERSSDFKRSAALHSEDLNIAEKDLIPIFYREETDSEEDLNELEKWLKKYQPDCVLGVGKDVPHQLDSLGYTQPQKVGFAHLGWHSSYEGYAGYNPKWSGAGKVAVNLVVDQLTRNENGVPEDPLWILVEGEWVDGHSATPVHRSRSSAPRKTSSAKT